jgi:hypothetical protein
MPSFQYTIERLEVSRGAINLIVTGPNWRINRRVTRSKIDTKEKLAQWIVDQQKITRTKDAALEGTFDIVTEFVTVFDPELGRDVQVERVVSVTKVQLSP